MNLIKLRYYLLILIAGIVVLVLGGIFDRQVSEALYVNSNTQAFGVVISNYMLLPFFITASTVAFTSIFILVKDRKDYHKAFVIIALIVFIGLFAYLLYQEYDKISDIKEVFGSTAGLIASIITVVITVLLALLLSLKLFKKYDHHKILKLALCYVGIVGVSLVMAVAIKYLWSRPRPWYIFGKEYAGIESHLAEFRNFYEPQPFAAFTSKIAKEYFKSFPSNHVNSATMFLPGVLLYTKLNDKLNNEMSRSLILLIGVLVAILVGFNRIVCGAHFLSDVAAGFTITFTINYFGFIIVDRLNKHYRFFGNDEPQVNNM